MKKNKLRRGLLVLVLVFLSSFIFLYYPLMNTISSRIRVDGFSMEPTLQSGEYVVVSKISYWFNEPEPGDIVVFHFPRKPDKEYIKRVIGIPGDTVRIVEGSVYINEVPLDEPYVKTAPAYVGEWTVPDNALFVLGDNRNNSSDSHNWGFVPYDHVIGKAVFVYWPAERQGIIESPNFGMLDP